MEYNGISNNRDTSIDVNIHLFDLLITIFTTPNIRIGKLMCAVQIRDIKIYRLSNNKNHCILLRIIGNECKKYKSAGSMMKDIRD